MKQGDILTYCGDTTMKYTKNKKYTIKESNGYDINYKVSMYFKITDDAGESNWYHFNRLNKSYFKTEKDLRKEKLEKLCSK